MEEIANQVLPSTMGFDWTGIAYQEKRTGGEAVLVFGMAVVFVYLVLAALYESWLLPMAVMLVVPLGLLGVVAAVNIRAFDNNIYTQIGIVLIIALASKNAILIVEFARELRLTGPEHPRRGHRGVANAVPADHHDELRVHPGRGAAGLRDRRRGGQPAIARHGRLRRDDYLDRAGGLLRAGLLRRDSVAHRIEEWPAQAAPRRGHPRSARR